MSRDWRIILLQVFFEYELWLKGGFMKLHVDKIVEKNASFIYAVSRAFCS